MYQVCLSPALKRGSLSSNILINKGVVFFQSWLLAPLNIRTLISFSLCCTDEASLPAEAYSNERKSVNVTKVLFIFFLSIYEVVPKVNMFLPLMTPSQNTNVSNVLQSSVYICFLNAHFVPFVVK